GQYMIHAITCRDFWKFQQSQGIAIEFAQTQVGVLAAIKAPQENTVRQQRQIYAAPRSGRCEKLPQPGLDDGSLALPTRANHGRQADFAASKRLVQQRQLRRAAEELKRFRRGMTNARRAVRKAHDGM